MLIYQVCHYYECLISKHLSGYNYFPLSYGVLKNIFTDRVPVFFLPPKPTLLP
jgi:hypothetical protein